MDKINFQLLLGTQIRLLRKAQGFSQERLAELAEVHPTFISNVERGKKSASSYICYRLAQALGVSAGDLFGSINDGSKSDLEIDLVNITVKIRQMDDVQRGFYLTAIKGMLQS
jgi:transcriptional regulator with XRE-family HTH domain